jgi:ABC-2 type transport system permease protein
MVGFSLRRMAYITYKEFHHIVRDVGFEYTQLALLDFDQSQSSQQYASALVADGELDFTRHVSSYEEAEHLMERGAVAGVLVIPPGFGADLVAGETADVQLLVDGSDAFVAGAATSSVSQRTMAFSLESTGGLPEVFNVEPRVWFNPTLRSQHSMVPALIPIVLILPAMAAALGATRERQTGTFETLATTPVLGMEYLVGKLVAYMLTGLMGTLLALGVAVFWFRVPFRGSLALYMLLTADYFLAMMGACLLVSNFTESQQTATVVILLIFFMPSFFQTGLFSPVDTSSIVSLISSYSLPSTHFVVISRWIALRASGPGLLWKESLALVGMGLASIGTSIFLFKKKVA